MTLKAPISHYLLDTALSREIDRRTIDEMGIDGFTLMEIAGSSAAKRLLQQNKDLSHGLYLCGKGNNAGDALVIARYLLQNNIRATLVLVSGTEDLAPDTDKNLSLLKKFNRGEQLTIIESWEDFDGEIPFNFIVDGLLGTGLNSNLRGDYAQAVEWTNKQSETVYAIDIPTGLHADSGQIMGCAIEAEHTFAFGGRKIGFYLEEGPSLTGTIDYCELPFPNRYKDKCTHFLLDKKWVPTNTTPAGRHKYDTGVLYIIAGSEGLTGAAIMAARSAWAEGVGAVILVCPRGVLSIYEKNLPSIIKKPVGRQEDLFFKEKHVEEVLPISREKKGKILIGPGLGRDDSTVRFVAQFLAESTADAVIDADALWCLSELTDWPKPTEPNWIITPHPGELANLTGNPIESDKKRLETVINYAREFDLTILSKGMPGIVGTPSGKNYLTNYDTRYFARAGTGDVLAGKTAAYFASDHKPDTSCAMALLNGKEKLDHFLKDGKGRPEPTDLI